MFRYECSLCFKEFLKNVLFKSPIRCGSCSDIKVFEKVVFKQKYLFKCQHCGKNIRSNARDKSCVECRKIKQKYLFQCQHCKKNIRSNAKDKSCVECRKINKINKKKFCLGCSFFMGQNKAGRINSTCQHCHITSSFFSSK